MSPGYLVAEVIQLFVLLMIVYCVLETLICFGARISSYNPVVRTLRTICNPILDPIRSLIPPSLLGGFDISPLLVVLLLQYVASLLR
ncbi:MAG: YggT family protein [Armatimonadetes bacterium]|nr:YggT family protein [Armatimonadota bacterium]MDE2206385.1 YggT family protein [Armatimonadota bacterium]